MAARTSIALALLFTIQTASTLAADLPPRAILEQRFAALEAADLEGFLATHHDDVGLFVYPDEPLGQAVAHLRWIYEATLAKGPVGVTVHTLQETEQFVVVDRTLDFGTHTERGTAIYTVEAGQISDVRFLRTQRAATRTPTAAP